jgi:hypothetical protein
MDPCLMRSNYSINNAKRTTRAHCIYKYGSIPAEEDPNYDRNALKD